MVLEEEKQVFLKIHNTAEIHSFVCSEFQSLNGPTFPQKSQTQM